MWARVLFIAGTVILIKLNLICCHSLNFSLFHNTREQKSLLPRSNKRCDSNLVSFTKANNNATFVTHVLNSEYDKF